MPRLLGVNIPDNKRIIISLTYIYGIGPSLAKSILNDVKIDPNTKAVKLKQEDLNSIKETIEKKFKIEGELRREVVANIKRLKDISSWRGMRHQKHLPVRGQRTSTNTRTVRGNVRKTVGSGKKPAASPT